VHQPLKPPPPPHCPADNTLRNLQEHAPCSTTQQPSHLTSCKAATMQQPRLYKCASAFEASLAHRPADHTHQPSSGVLAVALPCSSSSSGKQQQRPAAAVEASEAQPIEWQRMPCVVQMPWVTANARRQHSAAAAAAADCLTLHRNEHCTHATVLQQNLHVTSYSNVCIRRNAAKHTHNPKSAHSCLQSQLPLALKRYAQSRSLLLSLNTLKIKC
jgi:hypothetical protein